MCTAQNCIEILRIRRVKQRCQLLFGWELSAQQANCLNCEQNKRIIAMCYCRRCMPRILNVSLQGQRASASHRSCCQLINNSLIQLNQLQTAPLLSAVTLSLSPPLSLFRYFRLLVACFNFWQCNNAIRNWQWKLLLRLRLWHWPCANSLRHKRKAQPRMAGNIDKLRERK